MSVVHIHSEVTGDGPAVLLTHGFAASSHMFASTVPALAADHTVIVWDMPGHGRSDAPDDASAYSTPAFLDHMLALIDGVGAEQAVVLGHSLGGYLSLELALAHPDRVRGVVLVDTGPGYRNDVARDGWNDDGDRLRRRPRDQGPRRAAGRRRAEPGRALVGGRPRPRGPQRAHAARQPRHRRAADDHRADARRRRRRTTPRSSRARTTWPARSRTPSSSSSTAAATRRRSPIPSRSTPRCAPTWRDCHDDRGRRAPRRQAVARRQLGPRPVAARVAHASSSSPAGRRRRGRPSGTGAGCPGGPTRSSTRSSPRPARSARPSAAAWASPPRRCSPTAPTSRSGACCRGPSRARTRGASCSASRRTAPTSPAWRRTPSRTATSGSSTARSSGARAPTTPTSGCCSPAPTRTCRSTRASATSCCRCTSPASRSARCTR